MVFELASVISSLIRLVRVYLKEPNRSPFIPRQRMCDNKIASSLPPPLPRARVRPYPYRFVVYLAQPDPNTLHNIM